jgi:hypothetical protein
MGTVHAERRSCETCASQFATLVVLDQFLN